MAIGGKLIVEFVLLLLTVALVGYIMWRLSGEDDE